LTLPTLFGNFNAGKTFFKPADLQLLTSCATGLTIASGIFSAAGPGGAALADIFSGIFGVSSNSPKVTNSRSRYWHFQLLAVNAPAQDAPIDPTTDVENKLNERLRIMFQSTQSQIEALGKMIFKGEGDLSILPGTAGNGEKNAIARFFADGKFLTSRDLGAEFYQKSAQQMVRCCWLKTDE
jgi:hypothetical protein